MCRKFSHNLLCTLSVASVATSITVSRAGDMRLPAHQNGTPPSQCEALRGLKVSVATAVVLLLDVAIVTSPPVVTGVPSSSCHVAVGMSVRPAMSSDIIQSILNSDPATGGPEVSTVAETEFGGTRTTQE